MSQKDSRHPRTDYKKMMSMKALTQQVEEHVYLMAQQLLAHVATDHGLDHSELVRKYLGPPPRAPHGLKDGKDAPAPVLVAAQQEVQRVKGAPKAPPKAPASRPEKQLCQAQTAKGTPCKFAAQCQGFCKKHYVMSQSQSQGDAEEGPKKAPKTKSKSKPRHEHLIEEEHEVCGLCESHGDVTIPGATREEYEVCGGAEITKRLRAIMAPEPEPEDPDDVLVSELIDENLEDPEEDLQARLRSILAEESEDEDEDPEDD
jgi:hypothetical protein